MNMKRNRISTVVWHDGYEWVIGMNWGGDGDFVRLRLSDAKANFQMPDYAFVVRLPRRFTMDWRGRVYRSRLEQQLSVVERLQDMFARDRAIC